MPNIERIVWLRFNGVNFPFNNCVSSDDRAILKAVNCLEVELGKQRGSLKKHFKNNPDDIIVKLK